MPIISIKRDWGTEPSAVRISTTDTQAAVETPGYLATQSAAITLINGGTFEFLRSDAVMVYASTGSNIYEFSDDTLSTLIPYVLDYHGNFSANNFLEGFKATVTAAGTTTLDVSSAEIQNFTGTTTQNVIMPDVTTLVLGQSYTILNNSSGVVTVKSHDTSTIQAMAAGTQMRLICISITDNTAAGWDTDYTIQVIGVSTITGTANQVIASSPTGDVTLSLPQDIATTSLPSFVNVKEGFSTTATATATTTLLVGSNKIQEFTGTLTQIVLMPVTSTLVAGQQYYIINNSSGAVTVKSSGANVIQVMAAGTSLIMTCVLTSGTTEASWEAAYIADSGASSGGFSYVSVAGTTQTGLAGTAYILNNAGATTLTLPTTASSVIGDTIKIKGRSSAPWIIQAAAGQTITDGAASSSVAGTATSASGTDSLQLVYVAANEWSVDWALSALITLA